MSFDQGKKNMAFAYAIGLMITHMTLGVIFAIFWTLFALMVFERLPMPLWIVTLLWGLVGFLVYFAQGAFLARYLTKRTMVSKPKKLHHEFYRSRAIIATIITIIVWSLSIMLQLRFLYRFPHGFLQSFDPSFNASDPEDCYRVRNFDLTYTIAVNWIPFSIALLFISGVAYFDSANRKKIESGKTK